MRTYKLMYRSLLLIHIIWALFMVASVPFIIMFKWAYVPAMFVALTTIITWIFYDGDCPLQVMENQLHAKYAPERVYKNFFTQHYLKKFFNIHVPSRFADIAMYGGMGAVVLIGVLR